MNKFSCAITCPFVCMSWSMSQDSERVWYITLIFLRLIFFSNAFAEFEKWVIISSGSWWLCVMKAVSSENMSLHTRTFLNLTVIEKVCFRATLYPFSLGGIREGKTIENLKTSRWGQEHSYPSIWPKPQMTPRVLLS